MLKRTRRLSRTRNGAAAVEFAVTASVVFLFFFAALEFSRVSSYRHTVEHAMYEGARRGIVPGATSAQVKAKTEEILRRSGINHAVVEVTPAVITKTSPTVSVRVQMALDRGLYAPAFYFIGKRMDRTFSMQREGVY